MIRLMRSYLTNKEIQFLSALTAFCIFLSVFRCSYTHSRTFFFLNWNLLLAMLPWGISMLLVMKPKFRENRVLVSISIMLWLLFFPNAPYILTDLFHTKAHRGIPMWYDLVLILSYAWTGLLYGLFSLWHIERVLQRYFSIKTITRMSSALFFVVAFGIYLGRVLRWNSWDALTHPVTLLEDILVRFYEPEAYPQTWGMTLLLGVFLNIVYWTFKYVHSVKFNIHILKAED
jgi:uncharacterized membrane protein